MVCAGSGAASAISPVRCEAMAMTAEEVELLEPPELEEDEESGACRVAS